MVEIGVIFHYTSTTSGDMANSGLPLDSACQIGLSTIDGHNPMDCKNSGSLIGQSIPPRKKVEWIVVWTSMDCCVYYITRFSKLSGRFLCWSCPDLFKTGIYRKYRK